MNGQFSKDDDLLSLLLIDNLLFSSTNRYTRKMNPKFRMRKLQTKAAQEILDEFKEDGDMEEAAYKLERLPVCYSNMRAKQDDKTKAIFRSHIKRYLALHAADANFKLVTTDRYRHFKVYDSDEEDEGNNSDASSALSSLSSRSDDPDSEDEPVDPNAPLDLGVIATKPFPVGEIIPRLLGSVADLTDEQDDALRGQRLDFSVTMNAGRNKFQALFGPARFVNHDCKANVEMTRRGTNMCFLVIRPIKVGDEVLASYGPDYFGDDNRFCLCATCERRERGAFSESKGAPIDPATAARAMEDLAGRVTRSLQSVKPLNRAERMAIEAEARAKSRLITKGRQSWWEKSRYSVVHGVKRKREASSSSGSSSSEGDSDDSDSSEGETKKLSYLQPLFKRGEGARDRAERLKKREAGLEAKKRKEEAAERRKSAPASLRSPPKPAPSYLKTRFGTGEGRDERSERFRARLGLDLDLDEVVKPQSAGRGRKGKKLCNQDLIAAIVEATKKAVKEEAERESDLSSLSSDDEDEDADTEMSDAEEIAKSLRPKTKASSPPPKRRGRPPKIHVAPKTVVEVVAPSPIRFGHVPPLSSGSRMTRAVATSTGTTLPSVPNLVAYSPLGGVDRGGPKRPPPPHLVKQLEALYGAKPLSAPARLRRSGSSGNGEDSSVSSATSFRFDEREVMSRTSSYNTLPANVEDGDTLHRRKKARI